MGFNSAFKGLNKKAWNPTGGFWSAASSRDMVCVVAKMWIRYTDEYLYENPDSTLRRTKSALILRKQKL
jgi:hypothetical protein